MTQDSSIQEAAAVRTPGRGGTAPELRAARLFELELQRWIGYLAMPALYTAVSLWMKLGRGYRIRDLAGVRRKFRQLRAQEGDAPLILCANHLTLIDSLLVIWALSPLTGYLREYRLFPWNFPEKSNFYGSVGLRLLCYLGQCIAVVRQGPREQTRQLLARMKLLLRHGDSLMIFPEGRRGRGGRIDPEDCTYSVGQLVSETPEARVLCIYLRGDSQSSFGDFPKRNEVFSIDLEILRPSSRHQGLRAARDLATRIIQRLIAMENRYFEARDRGGFDR